MLDKHRWQGNVRELKNAIERVVIYESASQVETDHIAFIKSKQVEGDPTFILPHEGVDIENVINEFIIQALDIAKGNKSKAARLLGISRQTLYYRMEKHSLKDLEEALE